MEIATTTLINPIDLINLSKDLAQLNLGYLGVSVAILGVLGGVFIYFNIKPLKDALAKQEDVIDSLKKEAKELLVQSKSQSEQIVQDFKIAQDEAITLALNQQSEKINLQIVSHIQELENNFSEKIDFVSEGKDVKLREIILSEATNKLATLEKTLTTTISSLKNNLDKKIIEGDQKSDRLKSTIKDLQRDIKELKVYRYSEEGKMGAIIYSIQLLKEDIDDKRWSILSSLKDLNREITGVTLEPEYISQIEEQLARIEKEPKYNILISDIRSKYLPKKY